MRTREGSLCELRMQVTDVRKHLMSVAKICDAGHRGIFWSTGGRLVDNKTGDVTKSDRVDDVYRLDVALPDQDVYGEEQRSTEVFSGREM